MREVGAFEAKNKLGTLLDSVERGEEVVITRRGRAVARLVPVEPGFDRRRAQRAMEGILEARRGLALGGLPIKELVDEGRP
ncbi:MAG: type II toxin-antitoxin system prevent-host-death family antitoxin [Burkholderiaceae bacterium]|nr:type II toxin-antitoxin system prevent-host-death family antitoxin [Burkholderiaceae bacterium]